MPAPACATRRPCACSSSEGPRYVRELIEWGARFDRTPAGDLVFGLEAAHSVHRILHAGDATGREISPRHVGARRRRCRPCGPRITRLSPTSSCEGGRVAGVRYFDEGGVERIVRGERVLLATGGAGQVFRETTNPAVATGDGIALAYHAGAARRAISSSSSFTPPRLSLSGAPRFLISEALRGEGARLVNVARRALHASLRPGRRSRAA